MKVKINADDLGLSNETNIAILQKIQENKLNSASIITTTNDFTFLKSFSLNERFSSFDFGIHLCLSKDGYPITKSIKEDEAFCDENGLFYRDPKKYKLTKERKNNIYNEFCKQVEKFKTLNINVSHLDSHQHIHFNTRIFLITIKICKKYNIPYIRTTSIYQRSIKSKLKAIIMKFICLVNGIKTASVFTNFRNFEKDTQKVKNKNILCELMCHPLLVDYNGVNIVVDKIRVKNPRDCELFDLLYENIGTSY